jgi:hypothetical protein
MPVKKRVPKLRDHPITPAAVAAYRAGDAWGLWSELKLKVWQMSPLHPKEWWHDEDRELYETLLAELEEAARAG